MRQQRKFDSKSLLARAESGELKGAELKKAIKTAQEMGLGAIERALQSHVVVRASRSGN